MRFKNNELYLLEIVMFKAIVKCKDSNTKLFEVLYYETENEFKHYGNVTNQFIYLNVKDKLVYDIKNKFIADFNKISKFDKPELLV